MSRSCWCIAPDLRSFSDAYLECRHCGTLVSRFAHDGDVARVDANESGLYGKDYWFGHMEKDLGFVNIYERARADLSERVLYWLRTLLTFKIPPARVLELGSAHGGLVASMKWAGFNATGLELSPTIADIARSLFDVDMLVGPIEDQNVPAHSVDVIVMMDVLEHLPNPVSTIRRAAELLKPGGFFLIQTPKFPEGRSLTDLNNAGDRFVEMLKPDEHLYLFSERSARDLFARIGLNWLTFEPALFSHYDMFFVASAVPLTRVSRQQRDEQLSKTTSGRLILALLDLHERIDGSVPRAVFDASEHDREARLRIIEEQGRRIGELEHRRSEITGELDGLREAFVHSEADREARLRVIEEQGRALGEAERARAGLEEERAQLQDSVECLRRDVASVDALRGELDQRQKEREALVAERDGLRQRLVAAEDDREARLGVIMRQGEQLAAAAQTHASLVTDREELRGRLAASEQDRAARLRVIEDQGQQLASAARAQAALQSELDALRRAHKISEDERSANLRILEQQRQALETVHAHVSGLQEDVRQMASARDVLESARAEALALIDRKTTEFDTLSATLADIRRQLSAAKAQQQELELANRSLSESNKEMEARLSRSIFHLFIDKYFGRR